MGQTDPSSFKTATVYVFDTSGAKILEKEYPMDLPAPKPEPEPVSTPVAQPVSEPVTTDSPAVPVESPSANMPVIPQSPFEGAGEAAGNLPMANPPDADARAVPPPVPTHAPVNDPSLIEGVEPVKKEDARSRF